MPCDKCDIKYEFCAQSSNIYFISEFTELITKTKLFIKKLNIESEITEEIISIKVDNTKEFFYSNIDTIISIFNSLEANDIKLFIDYQKEGLSYKTILKARPLQRYINMVEDEEFFDILKNQSLTSHFQAIIDAKTNSIYGYETLVRGVRADGTLIFPNELFERSTRNDMNFNLDRLSRESALKTAAIKKVKQKVFINFLPTSIYDPEFCLNSTIKWAKQLEFDTSNIVFEVVETESIKDQKHLKKILEFYREQGFKIALDDVGEGYSNLNMIIELKPDIIKVDRNIISNIDKDELKFSVYKALFNLARENNIEILAEGIETTYELETIKKIGVDYMQGYYFNKPMAEPIKME